MNKISLLLLLFSVPLQGLMINITNLTGFAERAKKGKVITVELQPGTEYDETKDRIFSAGIQPEQRETIKGLTEGDTIIRISEGSLPGAASVQFKVKLARGDQLYVVQDAIKGITIKHYPVTRQLAQISVENGTKAPITFALNPEAYMTEEELKKGYTVWSQTIAPKESAPFLILVEAPYRLYAEQLNTKKKGEEKNTRVVGNITVVEDKKSLSFAQKESKAIQAQLEELKEMEQFEQGTEEELP